MKSMPATDDQSYLESQSSSLLGGKRKINQLSKFDSFSKKIVQHKLSQIKRGTIILSDGDDVFRYGDFSSSEQLSVHLIVHDPKVYAKVLSGGTIGAGEAYMLGYWQADSLVNLVRLMLANRDQMQNMESKFSWFKKTWASVLDYTKLNSLKGSKKNILAHYDLSNDFFKLFLDPTMMYSSAIYYEKGEALQQASENKLKHICERLSLSAGDHLVEIGSGWGGMAIYAAKHYGCKVTTTTISDEQFAFAKQKIDEECLNDRITLLNKDYRLLEGTFDKLVSIEMIEAVGHQYYKDFFTKCSSLLKPDGLGLIQAITMTDQRYEVEKNRTDFIRRYIFPGGCLPSNNVISDMLTRHTDMQCVGFEDITLHYARTLEQWRERFMASLPQVKSMGFDDVFIRMWEFYLAYCEGGFRQRAIHTGQFLFAKPESTCLPRVY